MQAVVFHGVGDIRVDEVPEPQIQDPTGRDRAADLDRDLRHRPEPRSRAASTLS
jgi:Alcohol dehydrogenase GroES-associated